MNDTNEFSNTKDTKKEKKSALFRKVSKGR
jgi:hypothetical protein